jgi:hypothetical protein
LSFQEIIGHTKEIMMKVYSVLRHVQYEGQDLLGVFGSREEALVFAKSKEDRYSEVGVVESELGQPVDFYDSVEWVQ